MTRTIRLVPLVVLSIAVSPPVHAQGRTKGKREPIDPAGIARLVSDTGGNAQVSLSDATGAARFVRMAPGRKPGLQKPAARAETVDAMKRRSTEFFEAYGSIFGIANLAEELKEARVTKDSQGGTHITYLQVYHAIPVFAGELRSHFDASGELVAVNGTFVPEIRVDPHPTRSAEEAGRTALAMVEADLGRAGQLSAAEPTLLVYREGLAKGVPGPNHLAWQVEVGNGGDVREFVYVDAQTGKFIDQITGIVDGLHRRAYDGQFSPLVPPPNYPLTPFWVEGDPFPTGTTEADNMILSSKETYDFYKSAFGRDSFDGLGATMDAIFNRGNACPNASWNGTFISFCNGLTTDDVTGHEWTHAYTQYTHGLIYQWQPGALNESYSDIFGETIDMINGRMTDTPNNPRSSAACTAFTTPPPAVTINAPPTIAGVKLAGTAAFGPQSFAITKDVVLANDGVAVGGTLSDGCCAGPSFVCAPNSWANAGAIAGKFALVDRGVCGFAVKAKNAQDNGALGVIVANNASGIVNMAGVDPTITVPSLSILQSDGTAIKAQLVSTTVNATLSRGGVGADNSVRWLLGEDDTAVGLTGALRDMWTPSCYGNPGRVVDARYSCGTGDNGGVHNNSGVPNHAYALIVDGGAYNGQTISGIGLTKAAHIYFRAMNVYQGPTSDFPDHADALDQSCSDLIGVNLLGLTTGTPSGQVITASDCAQVAKAAAAVELRTPPTFCNFQPLLGQNPPPDPVCGASTGELTLFADNFEGNVSAWSVSHDASGTGFTARDWSVSSTLPDGRAGKAFFGPDPNSGTCAPGGDETGVLNLTSPAIVLPATSSVPTLTFEHWVATETGFDGGQLMISVNGGPYTLVPPANFIYNAYNTTLATATQGNSNPRRGQQAWSGTDGGSVDGSWGRSIVNLAGLAAPGQTIRLRWDISTDGCGGVFGWYVDDVRVYACVPDFPSATLYLRGTGPNANPPVLFLGTAPMAATPKYRDSASIEFAGGNALKEIGTWTLTPPLGALSSAGDLHAWIGLKNSDDVGTRFDVRAELYKNGVLFAEGLTRCIQGVASNPNSAQQVAVDFSAFPAQAFSGTDALALRISTRIGTNPNGTTCGGHSNAVGLRLYFDSINRASSFGQNQ